LVETTDESPTDADVPGKSIASHFEMRAGRQDVLPGGEGTTDRPARVVPGPMEDLPMHAAQAPPAAQLEPPGLSASDIWLSRPQAVNVLGLPAAAFDALVREGKVASRCVGKGHPRYSLRSVQAHAAGARSSAPPMRREPDPRRLAPRTPDVGPRPERPTI
jgi:hypothetical protein